MMIFLLLIIYFKNQFKGWNQSVDFLLSMRGTPSFHQHFKQKKSLLRKKDNIFLHNQPY